MSWVKTVTKTMKLVTYPEVSVTTSATRLAASQVEENHGGVAGVIVCADSANATEVYIGNDFLTATNGIPLAPGEKISLSVFDPYDLWAVTASGTNIVRVAKI